MLILGISGRKQSGKSTTGNFIYSLIMFQQNISQEVFIDGHGRIIVSDLLGDKNYEGIFDPTNRSKPDYVLSQVFSKLDPHIKIYNFADPLKNICMDILGLKYYQCYGTDEQKNELVDCYWQNKQLTAREVMQMLGTDVFRTMQQNVWANSTIRNIKKDQPKIAIITDCRFPNEVEVVKKEGGKIIRLTRDPHNSDHLSETILDKKNYNWNNFDYILDNQEHDLLDQLSKIQEIIGKIL